MPSPECFRRVVSQWGALLIALSLFLGLALYQLSLPGLHYDEAREAGVNALQLMQGLPVEAFRGATVRIAGRTLPLMVQDYIGALNVYLAIPFLVLGGVNVVALRLLPVVIAALTLVLVYRLVNRQVGPIAASLTALLLAVNPSFVFWSRQGIFVTNITALLAVMAAMLALRVARHRRPADWAVLGLVCGLGLWAKLLFVWVIGAGLTVALIGFIGQRQMQRACQVSAVAPTVLSPPEGLVWLRQMLGPVLGMAGLLGGMAPLLVFNLQTSGTLISVFAHLERSYYGVNNADFLHNLERRAWQLWVLLNSEHLWYLGEAISNQLAPWLAITLLVSALIVWAARPQRQLRQLAPLAGGLLFVALYVVQSSFTISDLFITHYATGLPFIFLVVGSAVGVLVQVAGRRGMALALALTFAWAGSDLVTDLRYHQVLRFTGGHGTHSDAIYALAGHLIKRPEQPVVALDWGIAAPVYFLTKGRVNPVELFGYERLDAPDPGFEARLLPYLENPDTVYLFRSGDDTIFEGRRQALKELALREGRRFVREIVIRERTRRTAFRVMRVVP
ncbi:MAG: glycosyltransferase family 39 protein [Anaerolineae bacterium]|nr:glycosyltransferase family 39 protein [Anaerolineae bacterium]MDW8099110.1 glycosyltransferase family 39 protein [Anaerolineae bacterium]